MLDFVYTWLHPQDFGIMDETSKKCKFDIDPLAIMKVVVASLFS